MQKCKLFSSDVYGKGQSTADTGNTKGEVSLYCWPPVWLVWNKLYDNWQFSFLFLSFQWFILMNAEMSTKLKEFLQIYELFRWDTSVSKKFPMVASPRLYLDIFFQIYEAIYGNRWLHSGRNIHLNIPWSKVWVQLLPLPSGERGGEREREWERETFEWPPLKVEVLRRSFYHESTIFFNTVVFVVCQETIFLMLFLR